MTRYSIRKLIQSFPGERQFGPYRFLPVYFILGALVEWSMINWSPSGVNFCELFNIFIYLHLKLFLIRTESMYIIQ